MRGLSKYRSGALVIILTFITSIAVAVTPANANANITSSILTCNSLSISGSASTPFVGLRLARGTNIDLPNPNDIIYDSFFNGVPIFNVINGAYTIYVSFPYQAPGATLTFRVFGAIVQNGVAWDGGGFGTVTAQCAQTIPANFPIPTLIPVGGTAPLPTVGGQGTADQDQFVLRTIICDTSIYNAPGGAVIANTGIKTGQTWFIRNRTSADGSGQAWAEVSIGGFIPARCVAGLGNGGIGNLPVPQLLPVDGGGGPVFSDSYVVQKGDTLGSIAQKFGVTVSALARANGIKNINLIYVGQVLIIP